MASPRIGSPGVGFPYPSINSNLTSSVITMIPCQKWTIPSGTYSIDLGPYTQIQELDPVSGIWFPSSAQDNGAFDSDGTNFRLVNITGGAVGSLITNAGTGYLTAPTVTPSIGSSTWRSIIGGRLSNTVTLVTTGVGYIHPPTVMLPPPPAGGIPATATAIITAAGLLTGITLNNTGAGYTSAPTTAVTQITALQGNTFGQNIGYYQIIPDPLDTITTPAVFTFGLDTTTATNLSAILCTDPGLAVTSVPTLAIQAAPAGGTTAVATAVMMFAVTGITVTAAGTAFTPSSAFQVVMPGQFVGGTSAVTNPAFVGTGLFQPQPTFAYGTTTAAGVVSTASFVISNAGLHQAVPSAFITVSGVSVPTGGAAATAQVGGVTDTSILIRV